MSKQDLSIVSITFLVKDYNRDLRSFSSVVPKPLHSLDNVNLFYKNSKAVALCKKLIYIFLMSISCSSLFLMLYSVLVMKKNSKQRYKKRDDFYYMRFKPAQCYSFFLHGRREGCIHYLVFSKTSAHQSKEILVPTQPPVRASLKPTTNVS